MSHVVPDLVQKIVKGQDPLHILGTGEQVRCYTYGGDLAKGIAACMFHPAATNEDFNLSTPTSTNVKDLAELIWRKIHGAISRSAPFPTRHIPMTCRCACPKRARRSACSDLRPGRSLDTMLDEVIPWIKQEIEHGRV